MDPERQPLLGPSTTNARYGNRPLTYEEVRASRHALPWRRSRMVLVVIFWGIVAMLISTAVCLVITTPPCAPDLGPGPTVPSAHLTFAPLVAKARSINHVYAL